MKSWIRGLGWVTAIVAAILVLLFLFVVDSWVVPNDPEMAIAIEPTLAPGDRIVIKRGGVPNTGQLARCVSPENPSKYVIARVFGIGGDTVEMNAERVVVSGRGIVTRHGCPMKKVIHPLTGAEVTLGCAVEESFANWTYQVLFHPENPEPNRMIQVPPGKLYLVSDDRHFHQDSRDFGPVDASTCEHVIFRLWGEHYTDGSRRFNILW